MKQCSCSEDAWEGSQKIKEPASKTNTLPLTASLWESAHRGSAQQQINTKFALAYALGLSASVPLYSI